MKSPPLIKGLIICKLGLRTLPGVAQFCGKSCRRALMVKMHVIYLHLRLYLNLIFLLFLCVL